MTNPTHPAQSQAALIQQGNSLSITVLRQKSGGGIFGRLNLSSHIYPRLFLVLSNESDAYCILQ